MNDVEMKRNCVDCGQEFTIPPYQQMFYTNRGWELPKRCKACREKKKQERQKKEAEEATRQFEKELSDSPYAIREVCSAGLAITAFPAARLAATCPVKIAKGKFQGEIQRTFPRGAPKC